MPTLRLTLFTILLTLGAMPLAVAAAAPANAPRAAQAMTTPVLYDKGKDTLSVEATAIPLKEILGYIATQSGIEVLFDGKADRPVTAKFRDRPFEEALKNLLKESNYSLRYKEGKKPLLIGVKVLPVGEAGNPQPLLPMPGEAFMQEKDRRHGMQQNNLSAERWKARLAELPPNARAEIEKRAKERNDELDKRRAEREKKLAESKAAREKRRAEREAKRQSELELLSPEDRALKEERRANAKKMAQESNL